MAEEQKQAPAPGGAPRREGGGGHGGHGGGRREGGPGGAGPGGPGGRPRGKRQYFRKKKVCKFCVEKMDFIDYKRARNIALLPFAGSAAGTQAPRVVVPGTPHAAPSHGTPAPAPVTPAPAAEAPKA